MTHHLTINGDPYTATAINHPDGPAFAVTAASSRTDRFHRSYCVRLTRDGKATRDCSCPSCHHQSRFCKHLRAVDQLLDQLHPERIAQRREEAARCGFLSTETI